MVFLQTVISEQTLVPIGIACAVLAPVCGWLIWLNGKLSDIRNELAILKGLHSETWSFAQMETWALRLKTRNQNIDVPDPEPPMAQRAEDPRRRYGVA